MTAHATVENAIEAMKLERTTTRRSLEVEELLVRAPALDTRA
jgi:hypothetical protein